MTTLDPPPGRPARLGPWLLTAIGFVGGIFVLIWALAVASDQGVGDLDVDDLNDRATCELVDGQAEFRASVRRDELPDGADTLRVSVEFGSGGFPLELLSGEVSVADLEADESADIVVAGPEIDGSPSCTVVDASVR